MQSQETVISSDYERIKRFSDVRRFTCASLTRRRSTGSRFLRRRDAPRDDGADASHAEQQTPNAQQSELHEDGTTDLDGIEIEQSENGKDTEDEQSDTTSEDGNTKQSDNGEDFKSVNQQKEEQLSREQLLKEVEGSEESAEANQESNDPEKRYDGDDPYREPIE